MGEGWVILGSVWGLVGVVLVVSTQLRHEEGKFVIWRYQDWASSTCQIGTTYRALSSNASLETHARKLFQVNLITTVAP